MQNLLRYQSMQIGIGTLTWYHYDTGVQLSDPPVFVLRRDDKVGKSANVSINTRVWHLFEGTADNLDESPNMWSRAVMYGGEDIMKDVANKRYKESIVEQPTPTAPPPPTTTPPPPPASTIPPSEKIDKKIIIGAALAVVLGVGVYLAYKRK